jgi:hypothetical protein
LENPEGRAKELPFITAEFEHVGFLNNPGNGFRLRSPHEQAVFSEKLHAAGLSVPLMHYSTSEFLLMDFYPNTTTQADLWRLAPQRALNSTKDILQGLALAHKEDLILGDRWGKNELISPNQEVSFVDFDIELFGPQAKEFELAMFLFFNAYFAQLNSGELLGDLLELSSDFLSILPTSSEKQVRTFVRNFSDYFKKGTIYAWRNNKDVDQLKDILC